MVDWGTGGKKGEPFIASGVRAELSFFVKYLEFAARSINERQHKPQPKNVSPKRPEPIVKHIGDLVDPHWSNMNNPTPGQFKPETRVTSRMAT